MSGAGRTVAAVAGRLALALMALAVAAGLAGCDRAEPKQAAASASAPPPAAAAGGACNLLDFTMVSAMLGAQATFDVAAAGTHLETYTCVLQRHAASLPDLTLAVTPVSSDPTKFTRSAPAGSVALPGLGKAAYGIVRPAAAGVGPVVEVGWLSANGRLLVLRYRMPPGTKKADSDAMATRLPELAKVVDLVGATGT